MDGFGETTGSPVGLKTAVPRYEDDAVSSATQQVGLGDDPVAGIKAFGSPHMASPIPASPLDAAAKQLNFDMGGNKGVGSPATPGMAATPVTPAGAIMPERYGQSAEGAVDYDTFIKDTVLWHNKVRSAVYLVGGLLSIYTINRLLTSNTTLLTGVCYVLLAQVALNFLRAFISPKLQERCTWHDSAWLHGGLASVNGVVKGAGALHDRHLNGLDPVHTLRIVVALWVISLAGRTMSLVSLTTLLWLAAFTAPKAYVQFKPKVDQVVGDVTQKVKAQFFKLDPKARAALVVVPIFAAGYALSTLDLAVAVLALMLYGRSCMAPAQVDRLNAVVAPPITNTVSKVGGTVSRIMQNAATKYDLTPTPAKAKRA